jgi:hypothetical protein
MALRHIREILRNVLILTDSLSLIKAMLSRRISWQTHPLVYECKQLCFDLMRDLFKVKLMWIPSHVGLVGNELLDGEARYASLNGSIFDRPLSPCDFHSLARPVLLRKWQRTWDLADTGRFAHSILRVRKMRGAMLPLYLELYLDIILFGHTWIDLELLKGQCVYV